MCIATNNTFFQLDRTQLSALIASWREAGRGAEAIRRGRGMETRFRERHSSAPAPPSPQNPPAGKPSRKSSGELKILALSLIAFTIFTASFCVTVWDLADIAADQRGVMDPIR